MKTAHFTIIAGGLLLNFGASGCRTVGGAFEAGGQATRGVVGSVEPTGVIRETEERRQLWKATRERLESLELEKINAAINELSSGAVKLTERIDALRTEDITTVVKQLVSATSSLRQQIEAADLPQLVEAVYAIIGSVDTEVIGKVDVDEINELTREVRGTSTQLRQSVFQLESTLTSLIADVQKLTRNVNRVMEAIPTEQVERTVAAVDETTLMIRSSTVNLPNTMARLDDSLDSLRWLTRVLLVVAMIFGLGVVVWLLRMIRPAQARPMRT